MNNPPDTGRYERPMPGRPTRQDKDPTNDAQP